MQERNPPSVYSESIQEMTRLQVLPQRDSDSKRTARVKRTKNKMKSSFPEDFPLGFDSSIGSRRLVFPTKNKGKCLTAELRVGAVLAHRGQ